MIIFSLFGIVVSLYGIWNFLMWIWSIDEFYIEIAIMAFALFVLIPYSIYRAIKSEIERKRDKMFTRLCFDCAKDIYGIEGKKEDYVTEKGYCQQCFNTEILKLRENNTGRRKIDAPDEDTPSVIPSLKDIRRFKDKKKEEQEAVLFISRLIYQRTREEQEEQEKQKEQEQEEFEK